ncbi:MAG: L-threonylcarbamoyladenylate synthase [Candidatus Omnitrophica bacterium]|nr:L-threonylcarbamoyladenylate synthase [Candidatus Omnitrophota bacterium]
MKASVIKIDPEKPDKEKIAAAAKIIKNGGLVVFPTETVYGIAANLLDEKALERLYRVKARPEGKPFTVHISDLKMIRDMGCVITVTAEKLIARFWPGPLTIILKSDDGRKIGFRMPANKTALELIRASGVPVVAPSANLSGRPAPVTADEAMADLEGKIDMIIDGGRAEVGLESTVVDLTVDPFKIMRAGAIKEEELSRVVNG